MLSRLIRPPRVRTAGAEGEIRRATWMELFYDLVFVVTQLGNRLSTDHTFVGVLGFVALFIPVWWGTRSTPRSFSSSAPDARRDLPHLPRPGTGGGVYLDLRAGHPAPRLASEGS
jgi:hypothetical protein